MRRFTLALIVFGSILLLFTSTQGARSQISLRTDLVLVPVTVRGDDEEFVTNLTKEDFVVREDGQPQTITSFDNEPQPFSAVILIDDGIGGIALKRVTSLLFAMAAGIAPEDDVCVIRYDRNVDKLSDFSADPKVLQKSFDAITKIAETRTEEQHELIKGGPGWLRSILGIFPDGSKGSSKNHILHTAVYEATVALQSKPASRRKIIFLVSDGEASGPADIRSPKENTDLLLKHDIQVFAVSTDYAKFGSYGALSSYATATGGDVYGGATDRAMEHAFNQITQQARRQYVLGYVSVNSKGRPGVFRTIVVKTTQPKQKVTHRKGYVRFTTP